MQRDYSLAFKLRVVREVEKNVYQHTNRLKGDIVYKEVLYIMENTTGITLRTFQYMLAM